MAGQAPQGFVDKDLGGASCHRDDRGKLGLGATESSIHGFTPTRVGKAPTGPSPTTRSSVHTHPRGESDRDV